MLPENTMEQQGTCPPAVRTDSSGTHALANVTNRRSLNDNGASKPAASSKPREDIPVTSVSNSTAAIAPLLDESQPECCICLGPVLNKATLSISTDATLGRCSHAFCFDCIFKWSKTENTCPLCKTPFDSIVRNGMTDTNVGENENDAAATHRPLDRHVVAVQPRSQGSNIISLEIRYWNGRHYYFLSFPHLRFGLHIQRNEDTDPTTAGHTLMRWFVTLSIAFRDGTRIDEDAIARETMNNFLMSRTSYQYEGSRESDVLLAISTMAGRGIHFILNRETEVESRFVALVRLFALFLTVTTGEHSVQHGGTSMGDHSTPELATDNVERDHDSAALAPEIALEVVPDLASRNLGSRSNATRIGESATDTFEAEHINSTMDLEIVTEIEPELPMRVGRDFLPRMATVFVYGAAWLVLFMVALHTLQPKESDNAPLRDTSEF